MQGQKSISEATIKRLPKYYRHLKELESNGEIKVSSQKLANILGITASKVRQDFCTFGGFGMQGCGYDVVNLRQEIASILGLDKQHNAIIIGSGNIGNALATYGGFKLEGFNILAMFDVDDNKLSKNRNLKHIDTLEDFAKENDIDLAIICTPKEYAEEMCLNLKNADITSVWNFAPIDLAIDGMTIENINMSESLFILSYRMKNQYRNV